MKRSKYVIFGLIFIFIFVISLNINFINNQERICGSNDDNSMPMPFSIEYTIL